MAVKRRNVDVDEEMEEEEGVSSLIDAMESEEVRVVTDVAGRTRTIRHLNLEFVQQEKYNFIVSFSAGDGSEVHDDTFSIDDTCVLNRDNYKTFLTAIGKLLQSFGLQVGVQEEQEDSEE